MLMDIAWVKDCFEAWRTRTDEADSAELAFLLADGTDAVQLKEDAVWTAAGGERFHVRAEQLSGQGATLVRIRREGVDARVQAGLSRREQEVFACLAEGLSYKEIARRLFISCHTARKHIENIYTKLDVCNRVEAINKLRGTAKIRQTA